MNGNLLRGYQITEKAVLDKHVKEAPPPMKTFVRTIAPELDELGARMLSKRPEERIQDMATVVHELLKWEKRDTGARLRQVVAATPRGAVEGAGA